MKIERLNKENIKDFLGDLNIEDSYLESNFNKIEIFGVKKDNTFYMAFEMLPDEDRIAIKYINNKISSDKYLESIIYLKNSVVVNNHLIINVFDDKYISVMDDNYRVKDVYVSSDGKCVTADMEEYAEIDMMNIRYFTSKDGILCNLYRQYIQDEDVIKKLDNYFRSRNFDNISYIVYDNSVELIKKLGYKIVYKSYVIE